MLVAGGTGFVGVNLIKKLLRLGAKITATLYKTPPLIVNDKIRYIKTDLRFPVDCKKACENIDLVFMCAANTSGAKVIAETPLVHLTPNVIMNLNILEAAYEACVDKFLFMSSNTVYPPLNKAVKENDVTNEFYESYHIVGWMKRFTEIVCEIYTNRIGNPMKTIVVRPGNLYGPYDKFDWEKSKVIPALIRRAVERHDPFIVWGDGTDLKDFLYIDDYIEGMLSSMEKLDGFKIINIASGKSITLQKILKEILRAASYEDAPVEYDLLKPKMIPKRFIDITYANEKLGWHPKVSLADGIKLTVDWYRSNHQ